MGKKPKSHNIDNKMQIKWYFQAFLLLSGWDIPHDLIQEVVWKRDGMMGFAIMEQYYTYQKVAVNCRLGDLYGSHDIYIADSYVLCQKFILMIINLTDG